MTLMLKHGTLKKLLSISVKKACKRSLSCVNQMTSMVQYLLIQAMMS